MSYYPREPRRRSSSSGLKIRLLIAGAIVLFSVVTYMTRSERNPITDEMQRVGGMTVEQEIQIGLQSVDTVAYQHQGPSRDLQATAKVQMMGQRLINVLEQSLQRQGKSLPYRFDFHLLADKQTVNAFALPGGQVFITEALYWQFTHQGQLAGVLGHEIGHVIERHSAQRMAKGNLLQGMIGAAGVAGGNNSSAQAAKMVGELINMKYGRNDELESDKWGILTMVLLGYHPDHMLEVMDILEKSAGAGGQPEFLSTHPLPENRRQHIQDIVTTQFPDGLPNGLR